MRSLFLAVFLTHMLSVSSADAAPPILPKVRATIKSVLPSGNNVSTWLQKLPQKVLAIGAAGVVLCSSLTMTSCDQQKAILDIINTEYADPKDDAAGQYVTFYIDNQLYEGYWEITIDGQLLIEIDDGYGKIVLLEHMTGTVIPDHPDLGAGVLVHGQLNRHDVDKYGEVLEVYDNGFYVIEIYEIVYVHGGQSLMNVEETILVNIAVLPEDGGFKFLDDLP